MAILDALLQPHAERAVNELTQIREALERIALCLETITSIPAMPERKPVTEAALGQYGTALTEAVSPDDLRERLKDAGMSDTEIEEQLVKLLFEED